MKTMATCLAVLMVLTAVPVFAGSCGGGCDKDKDDQAFTMDAQLLCGGEKGSGEKPEMMCDGCGCQKDKEKDCDKPKTAPEPEMLCGGGCDKDKDETKTLTL